MATRLGRAILLAGIGLAATPALAQSVSDVPPAAAEARW